MTDPLEIARSKVDYEDEWVRAHPHLPPPGRTDVYALARALLVEHEALGECAEALERLYDVEDATVLDMLWNPLVRRALDDWRKK